jgi:hypothetical protein
MGKSLLPIEKQPLLCTPKWLIENGIFCKNKAYEVMNEMKGAYRDDKLSLLYETKMAIPWKYAQNWLIEKYGLDIKFS